MAKHISDSDRYDRQIRVWGAEAQSRIQNSKVLLTQFQNLNIEVAKNLVLAGVNITILDDSLVSYADIEYNFFLKPEHVGMKKCQAALPSLQDLNQRSKIEIIDNHIDATPDDFFLQFDVLILDSITEEQALRINSICRSQNPNRIMFWSQVFDNEGIFYCDFGDNFVYKEDSSVQHNPTNTQTEQKFTTKDFPALLQVLQKKWNVIPSRFFPLSKTFVKSRLLQSFLKQHKRLPGPQDQTLIQQLFEHLKIENGLSSDFSMGEFTFFCHSNVLVNSILGGLLSQEIIKALTHVGQPAYNVFVFDGIEASAKAFPIDA